MIASRHHLSPDLADEAENEAQTASTSAKRAQTRAKTAEESLSAAQGSGDTTALEKAERDALNATTSASAAQEHADESARSAAELRAAAAALERLAAADKIAQSADIPEVAMRAATEVPDTVVLDRVGVEGSLAVHEGAFQLENQAVWHFLERRLPRVELIQPTQKIPDTVSRTELPEESHVFMRGIFEYAGVAKSEWDTIFPQDDRTRMRLEAASQQLNDTLRVSWSQGKRLGFSLRHDSKRSRIDLLIRDPAVKNTYVRPSRRSSGFTHFFALKTILHAYQSEANADSFIWLFDEPGIYLHPDGQRDLILVLETLSRSNQVIYCTHSIFLANKNYPTRHRLLIKGEQGTLLDSKPFTSRWRSALDALGLSLPGTLLFASQILLVEGDSDAILINAMLRKLISLEKIDLDLNQLAVIGTGDPQNADALIRILSEAGSGVAPRIAVLVDGDDGGERRLRAIKELTDDRKIPTLKLSPTGTATEDHMPAPPSLFVKAIASYVAENWQLDPGETSAKFEASFAENIEGKEVAAGLAKWGREAAKEIANLEDKPSPVGIARAYANFFEQLSEDETRSRPLERSVKLAEWIQGSLEVGGQVLEQEMILEETKT